MGRFVNADALVATGQGFFGNNMFAYCGNNPVTRYDPSGCGWNEFWESIREWLEEKKEEAEENEDGTVVIGSAGAAAGVLAFGRSTGVTLDRKGNVGIIITNSSGAGMPSVGTGFFGAVTNAPNIYKQEGSGVSFGVSGGAEGVSVGYDYNVLIDDSSSQQYKGHTVSVGFGASPTLIEVHALKDDSCVWGVNLYDIAITVVDWIGQLGG